MNLPNAAIATRQPLKRYDKTAALRDMDLAVNKGEGFALLGPNGAGETT